MDVKTGDAEKRADAQRAYASPEQLRYARVLDAGMRIGLGMLVCSFVAYMAGWLPARVPVEQMPHLWMLSAPDYLGATGMPEGWGWLQIIWSGDILPLAGIAVLSGISGLCFAAVLPLYYAHRDWIYCAIAALEIAVLTLAASGVLTVGH